MRPHLLVGIGLGAALLVHSARVRAQGEPGAPARGSKILKGLDKKSLEVAFAKEKKKLDPVGLVIEEDTITEVIDDPQITPVPTVGLPTTPHPARAVGLLTTQAGVCTAWIVAKDLVVTNAHCIRTTADAVGALLTFDYLEGVDLASLKPFDCSTLRAVWPSLDISVLSCAARDTKFPGDLHGILQLADTPPQQNEPIEVFHHTCDRALEPVCAGTKKRSVGRILDPKLTATSVSHDADTLPGSSGAPLIGTRGRSKGRVLGIHFGGCTAAGACDSPSPDGRGIYNLATPATLLSERLRALQASPERSPAVGITSPPRAVPERGPKPPPPKPRAPGPPPAKPKPP